MNQHELVERILSFAPDSKAARSDRRQPKAPPASSVVGNAGSILVIAKVLGVANDIVTLVYAIEPNQYCQQAVATIGLPLDEADVGSDVCVSFLANDFHQPVILGKLHGGSHRNGELKLESDSQITLRCGKASISLKADGTVAIRGTNVASRASHTNRIRGGNVQIN